MHEVSLLSSNAKHINIVQTDHRQGLLLRVAADGLNVPPSLQPPEWVNCTVWRRVLPQCFNFGHRQMGVLTLFLSLSLTPCLALSICLSLSLGWKSRIVICLEVFRWTCRGSTLTNLIHFLYTSFPFVWVCRVTGTNTV